MAKYLLTTEHVVLLVTAGCKYRGRGAQSPRVLSSRGQLGAWVQLHIKMAAIQRIAKQAFITFRTKESPTFASNLEKLKTLVRNIHIYYVYLLAINFDYD